MTGPPAAPGEADAVLLLGGDGTLHRHLPRLVRLQLPVLVAPAGSGNDFARALGVLGMDGAAQAWRNFASGAGKVRSVDLGVITPMEPERGPGASAEAGHASHKSPGGDPHYFSCAAGCGLDGEIARGANRLPRWLRARGGYALSVPRAIAGFRPFLMKVLVPAEDRSGILNTRVDGNTLLAVVANTSVYGGGMRVAPGAKIDDGKLDVVHISQVGRMRLLWLFPTVYFGRHLKVPEVTCFQGKRVRIVTQAPRDVYADGEYVCQSPVEIGVAPGVLKVITP